MPISTAARTAMFAQETGEVFLAVLKIDHPDFTVPIRVVHNTQNVTYAGAEWIAYPFDLVLPDATRTGRSSPICRSTTSGREIAAAVRAAVEPPTVTVALIRASDPDPAEVLWPEFTLRNVSWDAAALTGDLVLLNISNEPYPAHQFTPGYFPGLFVLLLSLIGLA